MRKNLILSAAVTAALASTGAQAATYDIWVTGASALKTTFQKDLANFGCGGAAQTVFTFNVPGYTFAGQPDYSEAVCTVGSVAAQQFPGTATGDVINLHYAAELGSTWGIWNAYHGPASTRGYLHNATVALCPANKCSIGGSNQFDHVTDAVLTPSTNDPNSFFVQHTADIMVADVEPNMFSPLTAQVAAGFSFQADDNWPTSNSNAGLIPTKLTPAPTAANITNAVAHMQKLNGEVFRIIGHNIPGLPDSVSTNTLSTTSLRSILDGAVSTWNQVPEVGSNDATGTPIGVCRRDHGSGSEIAASLAFNSQECGAPPGLPNAIPGTVQDSQFYENPSTSDINACVATPTAIPYSLTLGTAAIGLVVLGSNGASTVTFYIDGIQPNAHNAANGLYKDVTETWAGLTNNQAGEAGTIASKLLADAADHTKLNANAALGDPGAMTNGQWITAAGAGFPEFAIYDVAPNSKPANAGVNAGAASPTSVWTKSGNSCNPIVL
jgi:hypothetical protein